jgi:hypothetical protein
MKRFRPVLTALLILIGLATFVIHTTVFKPKTVEVEVTALTAVGGVAAGGIAPKQCRLSELAPTPWEPSLPAQR